MNHTIKTMIPLHIERPTIFPEHVLAGVTLRNGELFPTTGLSLLKGQILSDEEVQQHRCIFAEWLGISPTALIFQQQVHHTHVRVVGADSGLEESDGMVTNEPGIVLCAGMADCAGILLYDPIRQVIAALHSGWPGTNLNILAAGLETMNHHYGTRANDVLLYISPCASGKRYVVRRDVAQYFPDTVLDPISPEEWLLNIRARIWEQALELGVQHKNIEISSGCTIDDERYHSHRRLGNRAGRMVAFIGLRQ